RSFFARFSETHHRTHAMGLMGFAKKRVKNALFYSTHPTGARTRGTDMTISKSNSITRRRFTAGTAATAVLGAPSIVRAQAPALKIAVLLPRSGYLAQAGQSCHRGALVAPKVLGDFGYRVELVHVDIESNPDVSRTQAEKLINE